MSENVIAFPVKPVEIEAANDFCDGPPVGSSAWQCLNCADDDQWDVGFAFYVTPDSICCWTCHAVQTFD